MKKKPGMMLDFMTVGISILAMSIVLIAYIGNVNLMLKKSEVNQIARKYILQMETKGYLTEADKSSLLLDLETIGLQQISINGTTNTQVHYGEIIQLQINGVMKGYAYPQFIDLFQSNQQLVEYSITEKITSTAKH